MICNDFKGGVHFTTSDSVCGERQRNRRNGCALWRHLAPSMLSLFVASTNGKRSKIKGCFTGTNNEEFNSHIDPKNWNLHRNKLDNGSTSTDLYVDTLAREKRKKKAL